MKYESVKITANVSLETTPQGKRVLIIAPFRPWVRVAVFDVAECDKEEADEWLRALQNAAALEGEGNGR